MTFLTPFSPAFQSAFPQESIEPWYLSGGVISAQCVAAYRAIGAASQAASYVNLNNPGTFDIIAGVAPTWASGTGWVFSGTQYLRTGILPGATTWSYLVRFSGGATGGTVCLMGASTGSSIFVQLLSALSGANHVYVNGATAALTVAGAKASGVMAMANRAAYLDGVSDGTIGAAATVPAFELYIGGRNTSGSLALPYSGNIQAVAIYNISLSSAQILAITTAIQSL